jgi:hypothetical protein
MALPAAVTGTTMRCLPVAKVSSMASISSVVTAG